MKLGLIQAQSIDRRGLAQLELRSETLLSAYQTETRDEFDDSGGAICMSMVSHTFSFLFGRQIEPQPPPKILLHASVAERNKNYVGLQVRSSIARARHQQWWLSTMGQKHQSRLEAVQGT